MFIYIYIYIGGIWTQIGNTISGEGQDDFLASSINFSNNGSVLALGASGNNGNGSNSGHIRVYDLSQILSTNYISLENTITLYPNPSSQTIQIKVADNTIIEDIIMYDSFGKIIHKQIASSIDVSALISGIYTVKITTNKGLAVKQIIVQ
jgi:hypothetical protein